MWRNRNPDAVLRMYNGAAAVENGKAVSHKIKHGITVRSEQSHVRVYPPKNRKAGMQGVWTPVPKQRYSQELNGGGNPDVHRQMSG